MSDILARLLAELQQANTCEQHSAGVRERDRLGQQLGEWLKTWLLNTYFLDARGFHPNDLQLNIDFIRHVDDKLQCMVEVSNCYDPNVYQFNVCPTPTDAPIYRNQRFLVNVQVDLAHYYRDRRSYVGYEALPPSRYTDFELSPERRILLDLFAHLQVQLENHIDNLIEQGADNWGRKVNRRSRISTDYHTERWTDGGIYNPPELPPARIEGTPNYSPYLDVLINTPIITKVAIERANELLVSFLDSTQLSDWKKHKQFKVVGNKSGNVYTITNRPQVNVVCHTPTGEYVCKYCTVSAEAVPLPDQLLAQLLMLKNDEDQFLTVALRHP